MTNDEAPNTWGSVCTLCRRPRRPVAFVHTREGAVRRVMGRPFRVCSTCDGTTSANAKPEGS